LRINSIVTDTSTITILHLSDHDNTLKIAKNGYTERIKESLIVADFGHGADRNAPKSSRSRFYAEMRIGLKNHYPVPPGTGGTKMTERIIMTALRNPCICIHIPSQRSYVVVLLCIQHIFT
jgi:hypothetical protein